MRINPHLGASSHIREKLLLHRCNHRGSSRTRLFTRHRANFSIQHTRQNQTQGLGSCRTTCNPDFFWNWPHHFVTIARGKCQTFKHAAHHVIIIGCRVQPIEHGPCRCIHKGASLASPRNIGVIEKFGRFSRQHFVIQTFQQIGSAFDEPLICQNANCHIQQPVNV